MKNQKNVSIKKKKSPCVVVARGSKIKSFVKETVIEGSVQLTGVVNNRSGN